MQNRSLAFERAKRGLSYRGRPQGRFQSQEDIRLREYLVTLAYKQRKDQHKFFNKIVEAWEKKESKYEKIIITCRKKNRDSAVFLITREEKVVAQFPIPTDLLLEDKPLKEFGYVIKHAKRRPETNEGTYKISDLKVGMKKINVKAEILEISKPKVVFTRRGFYSTVVNAMIGDETGKIKLCLWNNQIGEISKGETVTIERASISAYRGEKQINLGKRGKISISEK